MLGATSTTRGLMTLSAAGRYVLIGLYLSHTDQAISWAHSRIARTATHLYADSLKPENFLALPSRLGGGRLTAGGGLCALTLAAAAIMHSRAAQMQANVKRAIATCLRILRCQFGSDCSASECEQLASR